MDCRPSNLSAASFSVSMRLSMEVARRVALASLQPASGKCRAACAVGRAATVASRRKDTAAHRLGSVTSRW